ncbi:MAG: radical SAM protein [Magnetococcales bacterium]|nr:radical SAM protein [Magnetococcales bacterium]
MPRDDLWVPQKFLLQWHLTERCDRRCTHCYQEEKSANAQEMAWPELLEVLARFKAMLAHWRRSNPSLPAQITVTGGEPYLREDFPRFLEHLASERAYYSFAVLCNGSRIDPTTASHLARLQPLFVQVSVDGRPEQHDLVRGAGDFARVERAVIHLKKAGVKTIVSFTAHPGNAPDFSWVAGWAWRHGVDRLWADRLLPLGAASQWDRALFSPLETQTFFTTMRQARAAWYRRLWPRGDMALQRALQFLSGQGKPYRCHAGDRLLALLPDGTLLPCRRLPMPVGHVLDPCGLRHLYETHPLLRRLRHPESVPDACQGCFHARLCRGGLRCLAHAVTGDAFRRDPGCWLDLKA